MVLGARPIKPFDGGRWWLRRMRADNCDFRFSLIFVSHAESIDGSKKRHLTALPGRSSRITENLGTRIKMPGCRLKDCHFCQCGSLAAKFQIHAEG